MTDHPAFFGFPVTHSEEGDLEGCGVREWSVEVQAEQK